MKKSIVGLFLILFATMAWALPTVQQVEAEIGQGRYAQAETMMAEVVADKPGSAKAHYIYAELLAHNGNFTKATTEAAQARKLDPSIRFADAAKFSAFEQTLQREQNPAPRTRPGAERATTSGFTQPAIQAPAPARSGIPSWVWLGGLALVAFVLWRGFSRSRAAGAGPMSAAGVPGGYGPSGSFGPSNPSYGPGAYAPAPAAGSGLLGTGLAVAGGVAGGMLIDEMLHRRNEGGSSGNLGNLGNNAGIGGFEPDSYRPSGADQAANDLETRPIDFGNGADWDLGSGSDGGDSSGGGWD